MEDFLGNPIDDRDRRPTDPVPCPICGEPCATREALAAHARFLHGLDDRALFGRAASDRPARLRRWFDSLGFLPLWFVLPLNVGLVVLVVAALTAVTTHFTVIAYLRELDQRQTDAS